MIKLMVLSLIFALINVFMLFVGRKPKLFHGAGLWDYLAARSSKRFFNELFQCEFCLCFWLTDLYVVILMILHFMGAVHFWEWHYVFSIMITPPLTRYLYGRNIYW